MSHTITAKIEFKDTESLTRAVEKLGGNVIGHGEHGLYETKERGLGFELPGWHYPLVAKSDGTLAYDDFNGQWGNVKDIDTLKCTYTLTAVEREAQSLGWQYEWTSDMGMRVYHPSGGVLNVSEDGVIDADCFVGSACEEATTTLANAIGGVETSQRKPEYNQDVVTIQENA